MRLLQGLADAHRRTLSAASLSCCPISRLPTPSAESDIPFQEWNTAAIENTQGAQITGAIDRADQRGGNAKRDEPAMKMIPVFPALQPERE